MQKNESNVPQPKMIKESYLVSEDFAGLRLDIFLSQLNKSFSRQQLQAFIKNGHVSINKNISLLPKEKIKTSDCIEINLPSSINKIEAEKGELDILYSDKKIALINKKADITVHPSAPQQDGTLVNRLISYFPELSEQEGLRPGIVHRLDKDSSGLLLVCLDEEIQQSFSDLFAQRKINKEYLALVHGVPKKKNACIDAPIGRHPRKKTLMAVVPDGKYAESHYRVLFENKAKNYALLAVNIVTGRTHQIRVHLSYIGHPIIGDAPYGNNTTNDLEKKLSKTYRQLLHAWQISFPYDHQDYSSEESPASEKMNKPVSTSSTETESYTSKNQEMKRKFKVEIKDNSLFASCEPPQDFSDCLAELRKNCLKVVIIGMPGSGKSLLLKYLQERAEAVFSADDCVKSLYKTHEDGWSLLKARFGDRFFINEKLDTKALALAMRESKAIKKEVEELIHPLVWHAVNTFWEKNSDRQLAFAEIPLYCETGRTNAEFLVGISCPLELRRKRLKESRGWDQETIESMENWHWPEDKKMACCQTVIKNSSTKEDFFACAEKFYKEIMAYAARKQMKEMDEIRKLWFL